MFYRYVIAHLDTGGMVILSIVPLYEQPICSLNGTHARRSRRTDIGTAFYGETIIIRFSYYLRMITTIIIPFTPFFGIHGQV